MPLWPCRSHNGSFVCAVSWERGCHMWQSGRMHGTRRVVCTSCTAMSLGATFLPVPTSSKSLRTRMCVSERTQDHVGICMHMGI